MLLTTTHNFVSGIADDANPNRVQPTKWNEAHKQVSHCRADIPSLSINQNSFMVSGYYVEGDLGAGAIYTSVGADANSINAIQDASGKWFRLVISGGPVNLGWFGLIGDGITDNFNVERAIQQISPQFSKTTPVTVTISMGSPGIITLANHGFQQGTPVVFSTTGQLPTGIIAGVTYWVTFANLTVNTFTVSATWPTAFGPDQTPVNTAGSQSGVHGISVYGQNWIECFLPSGDYIGSGISNVLTSNGCKKVRLSAYGATTTNFWWSGANVINMNTGTFSPDNTAPIVSQGNNLNQTFVTLVNPSDASKFHIGGWVLLMALDLQGGGSFPPNNHYCEYQQITGINAGTGQINFSRRVRNPYKSTFPVYSAGGPGVFPSGGAALCIAMNPYWDVETEIVGININEVFQMYTNCRRATIYDCSFSSQGLVPTFTKEYRAERCRFLNGLEIDKLCELVEFKECYFPQGLIAPSSAVDRLVFDDCDLEILTIGARIVEIKNCTIGFLHLGTSGLGVIEAVLLEGSRITSIQLNDGFYDNPAVIANFNLVESWGFSNGTLSKPLTAGPAGWAVPGSKQFIRDFAGRYDNMGMPFAILDVRTDGVNTLIDTTLTTKPVGISTNSVVTISIGTPAVVSWTAHGLVAGTPIALMTTGALPTGLQTNAVYYVIAAGLGLDSFELSTSPSGTAIDTSGTQSGVHTAISNPLQFLDHPCPRITARNCVGSPDVVSLCLAPPDLPMFSYWRRYLVQDGSGPSGAGPANIWTAYAWGNLVSLSVNVLKAYGGAAMSLNITANAFDSGLIQNNLSQSIDMKTTGLRVITPTGVTGSVGADAIAAFGDWISGAITMVFSIDAVLPDYPVVEVIMETDQGITQYPLVVYSDPSSGTQTLMTDTDWKAQN